MGPAPGATRARAPTRAPRPPPAQTAPRAAATEVASRNGTAAAPSAAAVPDFDELSDIIRCARGPPAPRCALYGLLQARMGYCVGARAGAPCPRRALGVGNARRR